MPGILISGANRGLGLEWTRQYAETGCRVLATCRQPEAAQIHNLTKALRGVALDILLNNAGIYRKSTLNPCWDYWATTAGPAPARSIPWTRYASLSPAPDHVTRSE